MLRRKKDAVETKESTETPMGDVSPKSSSDEERNSAKYTLIRPVEEQEISLMDVLSGLLRRLKVLDKEKADLTKEIERLSEEAQNEAEEQEKELSTLKEQAIALKEVLELMRSHNR